MIGRRSFLAALALAACSRRERAGSEAAATPAPKPAPAPDPPPVPSAAPAPGDAAAAVDAGPALPRGKVATDTWTFDGDERAVVLTPGWGKPGERWPLLVALHGRGEARKSPAEGAMGWPRDYALVRAIERVSAPPLSKQDFEGFVEDDHLADTNRALAARPFAGVVVVCPYMPDVDLRKPNEIRDYAKWLVEVVLPRARRELPVLASPAATGIDGVSLGGAMALRTGLGSAAQFGAVGSLQAAIGEDQVVDFAELGKMARANNPAVKLKLLTSDKDYFRRAITHLHEAWRAAGLEHDFADVPGPHDYPFNRGPGAIEMLLWHDRVLARA